MENTFHETLAIQRATQTAKTFGHLAPKARQIYDGWILFTLTSFGDTCIIDFEFNNIEASPWFNLNVIDYIGNYTDTLPDTKYYGVFKYEGTYKKFKNGNYKFKGIVTEITC